MKKRILCFGDSNTWGYDAITGGRFDDNTRWTGILSKELKENYTIIEEGLNGRTTVFDDPLNEGLNSIKYIYPCLMSHKPIDTLIIMLGTNDVKERFSATPKNIADGLTRLIIKAKSTLVWREKIDILIISPILIKSEYYNTPVLEEMGCKCSEKSCELSKFYKEVAKVLECDFMDAKDYADVNTVDYMHINEKGHKELGMAIAKYLLNKYNTIK